MRTQVEPSSMATSKSCDMPIESMSRLTDGQISRCQPVTQFAKLPKVRPRALRIFGEWRHGHEPANAKILPLRSARQNAFQLRRVRCDAALSCFASYIDLDQHIERFTQLFGGTRLVFPQA